MSKKEIAGVVGVLLATLTAVGALALFGPQLALAEPVQQFSMQLRSERADGNGPVSFRLRMRSFDTTGLVPPAPAEYYVRLPRGAAIRAPFLQRSWWCDGTALRDALDARPSATPFNRRVADLRPFIRSLERGGGRSDRAALANARTCERARVATGTGLIDARDAIRVLTDPIPVRYAAFLARPSAPGAVVGVTILGAASEGSAVVRRYPVVGGVHAVLAVPLLDDPTPDGLYGLKMVMPTGPINGFDVRIAEIDVQVHSLLLRRGSTEIHSFKVPACPPSGHLNALMFTAFAPPTPSLTSTFEMPCPEFVR